MTIFAVICAMIFPLFHTGRVWVAWYWMLPIPNQMDLWPQFKSPLLWDVFAVSSYFAVSAMFWYVGLIPDLATLRDRAKGIWRRRVLAFFSMGWTGPTGTGATMRNRTCFLQGSPRRSFSLCTRWSRLTSPYQ